MQLLMRISHLQGYGRVKRFISQYAIAPRERWEKYSSKWETWRVANLWLPQLWQHEAVTTASSLSLPNAGVQTRRRCGCFCMEVNTWKQQPRENTAKCRLGKKSLKRGRLRHPGVSLFKTLPPDGRVEELLMSETAEESGYSCARLWGNESSLLLPLRLLANISFFH